MSWNLEGLMEAMITKYLPLPEVIWRMTASMFMLQWRISETLQPVTIVMF